MRRSLLALLVLAIGLMPRGAAAGDDLVALPKAQGTRVGIEADWRPARNYRSLTVHSLTFGLVAQIQIGGASYLDIDMPWGVWAWNEIAFRKDGRSSMVIAGNPTLGAHWADKVTGRIALFAGGSLTVSTLVRELPPIAEVKPIHDGPLDPHDTYWLGFARAQASTNRAYADLHRFLPDYIFLRGRSGIEARILPVLYYRADLTPIVAAPIGEWKIDTEFFVEINQEIEARASFGGGGGLRVQAVFMPTEFGTIHVMNSGQWTFAPASAPASAFWQRPVLDVMNLFPNDWLQTAIEPYLIWEPSDGFYARAGLLLALDDELGFGFDDGKVATFRITAGGKW